MPISQSDIGEVRVYEDDNGKLWRVDGWITEPAVILSDFDNGEQTTLVIGSPLSARFHRLVKAGP